MIYMARQIGKSTNIRYLEVGECLPPDGTHDRETVSCCNSTTYPIKGVMVLLATVWEDIRHHR